MAGYLTGMLSPLPSVICPDFFLEVRHFIGSDQTGSCRAVYIAVDLYDQPSALQFAFWYDLTHSWIIPRKAQDRSLHLPNGFNMKPRH